MPTDSPTFNVASVALRVAQALERVGVPYFLGGSLASSFQGEARATNDLDFVVDLRSHQVADLAEALGEDFDVDAEALQDAIHHRRSWNIFYLPLAFRIDLFILGTSPFDRSEFSRRKRASLGEQGSLDIKSPEDTVLRKLRWYRDGGELSQNQWRDVVQVLRVSGATMDSSYLEATGAQVAPRA
jgi:hypothetical protein